MDLAVVLSPVVIALGACVVLLLDLFVRADDKPTTGLLTLGALAVGLISVFLQPVTGTGFSRMVVASPEASFADALLAIVGIGVVLISLRYNEQIGVRRGEFYALVLFALCGMMLAGHSGNLLTVFVAIEMLSIPLYVLCGIARPRVESEESSLKYFLLGAFASGFLVFGIALIYGASGTLDLSALNLAVAGNRLSSTTLLGAGAALTLVGLGFKVAAVPFHMWTPDVYDGAPTSVTAFMATATKIAGFMAIARVFIGGLLPAIGLWQPVIADLAALTMVVGNVAALAQTNVKRMLAYSSIAHAGYLLVGIALGASGAAGVLFYLAAYAITSLAAFAVLSVIDADEHEDHAFASYDGLSARKPVAAWVMALAMFSLMGMPLTAGFVGKYLLFQGALQQGLGWLAIIGVLASLVSAYYYLRVIVRMFMTKPASEAVVPSPVPSGALLTMAGAAVLTLVLGILPNVVLNALPAAAAAIGR